MPSRFDRDEMWAHWERVQERDRADWEELQSRLQSIRKDGLIHHSNEE